MTATMMQCGHSANATDSKGNPCCAICVGIHPGSDIPNPSPPDFTGRMAKCSCGNKEPSSSKLPFFEYCGIGSRDADDMCGNCGYASRAHTPEVMERNKSLKCKAFIPRGPREFDRYYCGCRGWD